MTPEHLDELERLHRQWIDGDTLNSHMARAELECVLLRAAPALIAAAREGAEKKAASEKRINELLLKIHFQSGSIELAETECEALRTRVAELEAQLARVHDLQDRWWNHGDELDALYAERLSAALTPPEAAAGKEGKP